MIQRIREILLTKYIGSILIAMLLWQALYKVIETGGRSVLLIIGNQRSHSAMGGEQSSFPWDWLTLAVIQVVLYGLAAYWLATWLHPELFAKSAAPEDVDSEPNSEKAEP